MSKIVKIKFESINQAIMSLMTDKLGLAYIKKDEVFICTAHDSGTFPRKEYDEALKNWEKT